MKRVLLIDNGSVAVAGWIERLNNNGIDVTHVESLTEAENRLFTVKWDLILFDIMLTVDENEVQGYQLDEVDFGRKAGLCLLRKHKRQLDERRIKYAVFSIRDDLTDELHQLGLSPLQIGNKGQLQDAKDFYEWIQTLIGN